jgi:UDP-2,4-diacetamido-2,4,6-trideoxy-beta-L-altropyranose hydrolase
MKVFIRADASHPIGTGHVMRCLTLADGLRAAGLTAEFISARAPGDLRSYVASSRGYLVHALPCGLSAEEDAACCERILAGVGGPADFLIVDHPRLGMSWEETLRPRARVLMAIDDTADRGHECDILHNQNPSEDLDRCRGLTPERCTLLLGPRYALVRPDFPRLRERCRPRDGSVRTILVFFGGTDPNHDTRRVLDALASSRLASCEVIVVVGASHPDPRRVEEGAAHLAHATVHVQTEHMASLMARADLFIGSGGTSTWERCCLGLPGLIITNGADQLETAGFLDGRGIHVWLGSSRDVDTPDIVRAIDEVASSPATLEALSQRAWDVTDGEGTARVVRSLLH